MEVPHSRHVCGSMFGVSALCKYKENCKELIVFVILKVSCFFVII